MLPGISPGHDPPVDHFLSQCGGPRSQARDTVDDVHHQVVSVEVVPHDHVERRRDRTFFLVPADVQISMVRPSVRESMDEPRIAVVDERNFVRPVRETFAATV